MHVLDITIDHTKVAADLTDFPVLVVPADSPDWDALYAVATGSGGDIRAFKAGGTVELPREIVSFSIDLKTGEIHIKYTGTLSSTVDTVIELHADGVSADYAVGATYGRNAVWSGYAGVWHFEGNANDSTGNNNLTETAITYNTSNGTIGQGASFNGSTSFMTATSPTNMDFGTNDFSLSFQQKSGSNSNFVGLILKATAVTNWVGFQTMIKNNRIYVEYGSTTAEQYEGTTTISNNTWRHIALTRSGTTSRTYVAGAQDATKTASAIAQTVTSTAPFLIGRERTNALYYNGLLDEVRLYSGLYSANWVTAEHNNQNSPSTFYTTTAVATGTAYTLTCESGTLVLDAAPSALSIGRTITADAGALALEASPATLALSWSLALETGTLALSGEEISLARSTSLVADPANLSLDAQNAALRLSCLIDAQTLDMAINGAPAAISVALTQPLEPSSLLLSGEPVDFLVASIINPFCPMPNPFTNSASPFSKMDSPLTDFPKGEC